MDDNAKWINYLREAYNMALSSPDPSTQNGALILQGEMTVAKDCNRLPNGVLESKERWERPLKYKIIEHAERNAIFQFAARPLTSSGLVGATMVCPWAACADCARAIIQAGITKLVTHKQAHDRSPDFWKQEIEIAFQMLREANVEIVMVDAKIGGVELLHSGQKWNP